MRTVWRTILRHRVVNVTLAVLILFSVVAVGRLWSQSAPVKAAGGATTLPVLIIHGFNAAGPAPSYAGFECSTDHAVANGEPSYAYNYFNSTHPGINYAWEPLTIGYYDDDTNCNVRLQDDPYQSHCTSIPAQDLGSNNEDVRHLGCELAWYIYDNFTSVGQPVYVLAHSMGGLIIQWALEQAGNSPYPSFLDVPAVVTIATPHAGALGAGLTCGNCVQAGDMDPHNSFIPALEQNLNPQGSGGTSWMMIASDTDGVVNTYSALHMIGPKYVYGYTDGTGGVSSPAYNHVGLFSDQSDAHDASLLDCLGSCAPAPVLNPDEGYSPLNNTYRSLALAYHLLGAVIPPPPPHPVVDVPGGGAFFTVWQNTGGAAGPLGNPIDNWTSIPGGQTQSFVGGNIYWSSATNTNEVQGAIFSEYASVWNGPTGALNFPTSDELGIANGRVSYFYGNLCGSRGPNNSGAAIYYSGTTGAHQVGGCIYNKYWNMGGPNSQLSFPTSDVTPISGGYVSYFYGVRCGGVATGPDNSGSAIYSGPAGNFAVQGCVYATYQRLGGPGSQYGYPVSDENTLHNSSGTLIGWASYFTSVRCGTTNPYGSGSAIYVPASNNNASAGHEVGGCVFATYQRLGGPAGLLGFPVSDENILHNSNGSTTGWVSYFAGTSCGTTSTSGSAIYVSASNNNASSGHEVHGCIFNTYQSLGGPAGMGFPTSDEVPIHNSAGTVIGSVSYFAAHLCNSAGNDNSGSAIYHSGPETHEVQGCIYYKYWHDLEGPWGCLGFPTTNEYTADMAGDRESDFQHGFIFWQQSTGAISWACS